MKGPRTFRLVLMWITVIIFIPAFIVLSVSDTIVEIFSELVKESKTFE